MRRLLALLALCVSLLLQAAEPALAALTDDCLCAESACDADDAQPCALIGATCAAGQCGRSPAVLATPLFPDPARGQSWRTLSPPAPTAQPPDFDLRPPIV